jgi:3-polyprenyl-4-hydroxybenzoate decarboxylase
VSQDLRAFVAAHERAHPSEVVRVREPVRGSDIPIVCNVVASRRALAFALGVPEGRLAVEYARRIKDTVKPSAS